MILQTNPKLPKVIQDFGCYFCSVLYHAETLTKRSFADAASVLAVYGTAVARGWVGEECFVEDPVELFRYLGVQVKSVRKADPTAYPAQGEIQLLRFRREANTPAGMKNDPHDHFVAGDRGVVVFDPLGVSNTVKFGYLKSQRLFS